MPSRLIEKDRARLKGLFKLSTRPDYKIELASSLVLHPQTCFHHYIPGRLSLKSTRGVVRHISQWNLTEDRMIPLVPPMRHPLASRVELDDSTLVTLKVSVGVHRTVSEVLPDSSSNQWKRRE